MIKGHQKILILNVQEMLLLSNGTQPDQNAERTVLGSTQTFLMLPVLLLNLSLSLSLSLSFSLSLSLGSTPTFLLLPVLRTTPQYILAHLHHPLVRSEDADLSN